MYNSYYNSPLTMGSNSLIYSTNVNYSNQFVPTTYGVNNFSYGMNNFDSVKLGCPTCGNNFYNSSTGNFTNFNTFNGGMF